MRKNEQVGPVGENNAHFCTSFFLEIPWNRLHTCELKMNEKVFDVEMGFVVYWQDEKYDIKLRFICTKYIGSMKFRQVTESFNRKLEHFIPRWYVAR